MTTDISFTIYFIWFIITYIVIKRSRRPEHNEWRHIQMTFILSVFWPLTLILMSLFVLTILFKEKLLSHFSRVSFPKFKYPKPPKWL